MRYGYGSDATGQATHKYAIIDETKSGKYVCQRLSWDSKQGKWTEHPYGELIIVSDLTGIYEEG